MKDPAVLWYWNDWSGGTQTLTRHQKGCYMDLLHAQFNSGPLSLEEIKIVLGNDFAMWGVLSKKFKETEDGLFFNERLAAEKSKREAYNESRRNNRSNKNKSYDKTYDITYENHMSSHMENENENINEIDFKEKGGMGEKEKIPYEKIVESFNFICISLPKVQALTESRKAKIRSRWKELGSYEKFVDLFSATQNTPFCTGDNKTHWKASFDWLMDNDKNYLKVLEGNYQKQASHGNNFKVNQVGPVPVRPEI
jgi:uncharacterized protein YdaU (DUF1376 family)